jgi:hypothetical protein
MTLDQLGLCTTTVGQSSFRPQNYHLNNLDSIPELLNNLDPGSIQQPLNNLDSIPQLQTIWILFRNH